MRLSKFYMNHLHLRKYVMVQSKFMESISFIGFQSIIIYHMNYK